MFTAYRRSGKDLERREGEGRKDGSSDMSNGRQGQTTTRCLLQVWITCDVTAKQGVRGKHFDGKNVQQVYRTANVIYSSPNHAYLCFAF